MIFKDDGDLNNVRKPGVVLESVMPDSAEVKMDQHKSEIVVCGYNKNTNTAVPVGKATRLYNMLVVVGHVADAARLYPQALLVNAKNKNFELEIDLNLECRNLDTDLKGYELTEVQWSRLGIAKCSVNALMCQTSVTVSNVVGNGSHGKLIADPTEFGRTIYDGTTKRGYSGACYYQGDVALGMHISGGEKNAGYAMHYVALLVRKALKIKNEDTEDFLDSIFEQDDYTFSNHPMEPENVIINSRGLYTEVSRSQFESARARRKNAQDRYRGRDYTDGEPQSAVVFPNAPRVTGAMPQGGVPSSGVSSSVNSQRS
uniref:Uncharacterized protein n=1 Tax=Riboviria sp. TaxID=2585031 RepID=A0A8K1U3H7_9VIRU|nr:MAG: hypothetical protein 2 [Riboviria sp.]